ncbi:DUF2939 domain-containing protein [Neisseria montereyensis]|uniref:DUF2939 domain-containing protein n=1 Tax=Neisseria montereyensis TaxID=2973938 RepID=A0ABT2FAW7_9NEIS|nr:DUF2939 domain-containing protein [Neisseria montereyensis]MCS4532710.1 DUF2939 domain-containing protein [Neisseria montereyensis]
MKKILSVILLACLVAIGYLYYTPYIAIKNLARAAEVQDVDEVAKYIDSTSIKTSLSEQINTMMTKELMSNDEVKNNPLSVLALGLFTPLFDAASTTISTPEGITQLFNGKNPLNANNEENEALINLGNNRLSSAETEYIDVNTFNVYIRNPENEKITLVFERNGLIGWKMVKMRLPDFKVAH